jgi:WD40 repeat protein
VDDYLYSPDGSRFAVARWGGTVEIVATAKPEAESLTIKTSARPSLCSFSADAATIVLSPIAGPGEAWDLTGTPRKTASLQEDFGGVQSCAFSPDGKLLVATSGDTGVRFYDTASWRMVHEYRGLKLESFAIAFTPDGQRILIGGPDSKIAVFALAGNLTGTLDKDRELVGRISFLGKSGDAAIEYFDGEGRAPPHLAILELKGGSQTPLPLNEEITAMDVINGQLWLGSAKAGKLILYEHH